MHGKEQILSCKVRSMFSALNRAVTVYTGLVAAPLQFRETIERRLKKRIRSLGFPQAKGPHATFPHARKMCASVILRNQCESLCPVQQKCSLNKTEEMKSLLYLFLIQKK